MTEPEFRKLVKDLRAAQKEFFKKREGVWLSESRRLERLVDKELTEYDGGQAKLFAGDVRDSDGNAMF